MGVAEHEVGFNLFPFDDVAVGELGEQPDLLPAVKASGCFVLDTLTQQGVSEGELTGGDAMQIEAKFKDPVRVIPICKSAYATNFPIMTPVYDEAFNNRLVLIPFFCSTASSEFIFPMRGRMNSGFYLNGFPSRQG
jgi:hypothetical protein